MGTRENIGKEGGWVGLCVQRPDSWRGQEFEDDTVTKMKTTCKLKLLKQSNLLPFSLGLITVSSGGLYFLCRISSKLDSLTLTFRYTAETRNCIQIKLPHINIHTHTHTHKMQAHRQTCTPRQWQKKPPQCIFPLRFSGLTVFLPPIKYNLKSSCSTISLCATVTITLREPPHQRATDL